MCSSNVDNKQFGLACVYGDPHHRATHSIWADVHQFVVNHSTLPILCTGDLNDIMAPNEKTGPGRPNITLINAFCAYVKQCGLIDLGYSGPAYTWTNRPPVHAHL